MLGSGYVEPFAEALPSGGTPYGPGYIQSQNPAAWFRFGMGITVATGVSQWSDQTANARHLTQGVGANQPALQSDGSILFDGVNDQLSNNAFTIAQPFTVYLLGKIVVWALSNQIFNSASVGNTLLNMVGSSPAVTLRINSGTNLDLTLGPTVGSYSVLTAVFNGASSVVQVNNQSPVTGNAGANTLNGFSLAASITPDNWSNIQVMESIIFPAPHNESVRAGVVRYLAGVGGIAV